MLVIAPIDNEEIFKKVHEINSTEKSVDSKLPENTTVTMNIRAALPEPEEIFAKMREDGVLPPKESSNLADKVNKIREESTSVSSTDNKLKR